MRQTWRWFGPQDAVLVDEMRQAGVEGVVSALHGVAPGKLWTPQAIAQRQAEIGVMQDGTPSGLKWEVVESLWITEDIRKQRGNWRQDIATWKQSMTHLAQAGIKVICYNFMPVLDWTRTELNHRLPTGATCMRFDYADFAAFDIHILGRKGAAKDFSEAVQAEAQRRYAMMDETRQQQLTRNIVAGLPGAAETMTMQDVKTHLAQYDDINTEKLRQHLVDFLSEVVPHAQELGMRLCCHPDDPPFSLLGLPRVMSTEADYTWLMRQIDLPANGITLCSGSLGARRDNDLPGMMRRLGERVHFLHLRNVAIEDPGNYGSFHEAGHLEGVTDMVALMAEVVAEEARRRRAGRADASIPMRPDHGQNLLDDSKRKVQPGYPAIGRLKGLAELRGIYTALTHPHCAPLL